MVSASRASAPTGVFSSWLMLATKSRRTSSTRRLSVWSSASSRIRPPPPRAAPSGATRTAKLVRLPPNALPDTSISPSRISPSRRTWRASARSSPFMSWSPSPRPKERAAALARSTRSGLSSTTAEEESTDSTDAIPGGRRGAACRGPASPRSASGSPRLITGLPPGSCRTRACGRGTTRHLHAHASMVCALSAERSWPSSWPSRCSSLIHTSVGKRTRLITPAATGCARPGRPSAPLGADGLGGHGRRLGVEVPAAGQLRPEIGVQLVDERDAGRDVELGDLLVPDPVQVLDQRAQRIAVRDDQGGAPGGQVGDQRVVPVGQHALQHVLEALGAGPQLVGKVGVPGIVGLRQRVIVGERRRRHVVGTPPEHELLVPELLPGLGLVLALERAVVPLVEPP